MIDDEEKLRRRVATRLENLDGPLVVEILSEKSFNRYKETYSIWHKGDFVRTANGSRRAWSYLSTAEEAIEIEFPSVDTGRCELCGEKELCAPCGG